MLIHCKYLFNLLKSSTQALGFEGNFGDCRMHCITCYYISFKENIYISHKLTSINFFEFHVVKILCALLSSWQVV